MKIALQALAVAILCLLASCNNTSKVVYFQDVVPETPNYIPSSSEIRVRPLDKLEIVVNSKDAQTAMLLTLHRPTESGAPVIEPYTVNKEGYIDFPLLGEIKVGGLTRLEIQDKIKQELISRDFLKDPIVTVTFLNNRFVVNGEVSKPGVYSISKDRMNILEAITTAGDLTILGLRDNVKVIREEENGELKTYIVDLTSKDLFKSPVYYVKQNDVIYIEPNPVRRGQSTINENSWKSVSLWVSMASVLASIAVLVFR